MAKRTAWIMAWRLIWRSGHVREEASSGKATRVLILSHYYNLAVRRDTDMRPLIHTDGHGRWVSGAATY